MTHTVCPINAQIIMAANSQSDSRIFKFKFIQKFRNLAKKRGNFFRVKINLLIFRQNPSDHHVDSTTTGSLVYFLVGTE